MKELHNEIDIALVDVTMPQVGGVDLARRMFELKAHPNIILMTGFTPETIVLKDLKKPFRTRDLLGAVEKCLKGEHRTALN